MHNRTSESSEESISPLADTLIRILKRSGAAKLDYLVTQLQSKHDKPSKRAEQCLRMLEEKGAVRYDKAKGLWALSPKPGMN
jgi:hypothetical protein